MKSLKLILIMLLPLFGLSGSLSGQEATVKETQIELKTYPFFDPNPVANIGRIYPYFRYDGYSHRGRAQKWRVVILENPYIKVFIMPQIGGKIWGAIEKESGQAFIYYNHVVKFRDIAMRGPWTSGGIESNFGVIGHAPTCSTPVDYVLRTNEDGSVSCIIGAMDLPSRTIWRVDIRLPKDKAYFETDVIWRNPTPLHQSYYHWMNGAEKAAGNLQFFYPGRNFIGHGGGAHPWPLNAAGRDLSWYENNDFGGPKSYHVLGQYTEYFGGYWHDDRFGFGNWSLYGDKPGKKLWIWGLSRQGMIWEDLLTDSDGQYIEMQSGRLFNQAGSSSGNTPFKHRSFFPNAADYWREIWFPVKETKGIAAASPYGALNVVHTTRQINIYFCPLQKIDDELVVTNDGSEIYSKKLHLEPLQVFRDSILIEPVGRITAKLGRNKIRYASTDRQDQALQRPLTMPDNFDWETVQGLAISAAEAAKQRNYDAAIKKYEACLRKDPNYLDALTGLAEIHYNRMEMKKALRFASRALSIDTYDGAANFIYGLVNRGLGSMADAKDGFGLAAQSFPYRSAAYTQLAEISAGEAFWARAAMYARRALSNNALNMNARQILAVCLRKTDQKKAAAAELTGLLKSDPLNHFARFEKYLLQPGNDSKNDFQSLIRNEFPHETYLELTLIYYRLCLFPEAAAVLALAPENPVVFYWRAFLADQQNLKEKSRTFLKQAEALSPELIFPFRQETKQALQWALQKNDHWKTKYYLALIYWHKGRRTEAEKLFSKCAEVPDYAPFYLTRAEFEAERNLSAAIRDCKTAVQMDPSNWRAYVMLSNFYKRGGDDKNSFAAIQTIYQKYPDDFRLGLPYAGALFDAGKYDGCLSVLKKIRVLPYEGSRGGLAIYREAHLISALQSMEKKKFPQAVMHVQMALQWPENLGAGRPYHVDERLEDFIEMLAWEAMGEKVKMTESLRKIEKQTEQFRHNANANRLISVLAAEKQSRQDQAKEIFRKWKELTPDDPLVVWLAAYFAGNRQKMQKLTKKMSARSDLKIYSLMLKVIGS